MYWGKNNDEEAVDLSLLPAAGVWTLEWGINPWNKKKKNVIPPVERSKRRMIEQMSR